MVAEIRIAVPVARVLAVLLAAPQDDHYGHALMRASTLSSGTLYPILARLTEAGWVSKRWENVDPATGAPRARAYYRLTADGLATARQRLAELRVHTRPAATGLARKEALA